jgi:hypothetical protein
VTTHLFDISEFQDQLAVTDWQHLFNTQHGRYGSSGAAIIRIDYGDAHPDHHLANRATAHLAGVKALGLYQYYVDGQPLHLQTEAFTSLVKTLRPGEFAVLDLEEGAGNLAGEADLWFADVDRHLTYPGYRGGWLYSGEAFYGAHALTRVRRQRWVAAYRTSEPTLQHALWQHTDGRLGDTSCQPWPVIGRVDCSIFPGTVAQLAARIWTPPAPPKPKPTPVEVDVNEMILDPRLVHLPHPVWITDALTKRWVQTPVERDYWISRGVPYRSDVAVKDAPEILDPLVLVGPLPK